MIPLLSRRRFAMSMLAILVALDQLFKWLVETRLPFQEQVVVLPVFSLFRTHNEGIAFSMLTGMNENWLLAMILAVIAFVTYLWARSSPSRWISQIGFILVVAGALGNLIDRAVLGYVVDYLLFHVGNWYFAVFNFADALISVGAAAIVIDELFGRWIYRGEAQNNASGQ